MDIQKFNTSHALSKEKENELITTLYKYHKLMDADDFVFIMHQLDKMMLHARAINVWRFEEAPLYYQHFFNSRVMGKKCLYVAFMPEKQTPFWWLWNNSPFAPHKALCYTVSGGYIYFGLGENIDD